MPEFVHAAVRGYLADLGGPEDQLLSEVRARSKADGVPAISPDTARLLHVLAVSAAPSRILEIGTGYGCSGIQLASALATGGMLFTDRARPGARGNGEAAFRARGALEPRQRDGRRGGAARAQSGRPVRPRSSRTVRKTSTRRRARPARRPAPPARRARVGQHPLAGRRRSRVPRGTGAHGREHGHHRPIQPAAGRGSPPRHGVSPVGDGVAVSVKRDEEPPDERQPS